MNTNRTVESMMNNFASRTGLTDLSRPARRYLWTDAFAVCNFLGLYRQTKEEHYKNMALSLVDEVHSVLGRYHPMDSREGWISGLDDAKSKEHPTIGGLRIGKPLMERAPDEPYDEKKEWDSDGQYFHYLTKWMHALSQTANATNEVKYILWAVELAKTAHSAFTYRTPGGSKRMVWKMSTDLSRPLVTSMGQHDALDAYITYMQLTATASRFGEKADLFQEIEEAAAMAKTTALLTDDPLGIGGLLSDASRAAQLIAVYGVPLHELLISLLDAAQKGVERFVRSMTLQYPAEYRLAFRELGLSIGLHGVEIVAHLLDEHADRFEQKEVMDELRVRLQKQIVLTESIETFWMLPKHQQSPTWTEHIDINSVMLCTSLSPDGFLKI